MVKYMRDMKPEVAELPVGTKVWYRPRGYGDMLPGVIFSHGEESGRPVYDVKLDNKPAGEAMRWGYVDQFQKRRD